jgi:hypothetical protein
VSQPHLPAPLAARPEPGAQLLEAVRQRQAELSLQLAQHWVHRRGVSDLQRFCDHELAPAAGTEAVAWLHGLLGLDQSLPASGMPTAASPPGSGAPDLPETIEQPRTNLAAGGLIGGQQDRDPEASGGAATPDAQPDETAPQEIHFETPQLPDLQALDSDLQARAVAAVDEAFAALAQSFEEAARLTAPQPGGSVSLPSFSSEAAAGRRVAPEPMPVRMGLWPSLRASAATLGSMLRPSSALNGGTSDALQPPAAPAGVSTDMPSSDSRTPEAGPIAAQLPAMPLIQADKPSAAELLTFPVPPAQTPTDPANAAASEPSEAGTAIDACASSDATLLSDADTAADPDSPLAAAAVAPGEAGLISDAPDADALDTSATLAEAIAPTDVPTEAGSVAAAKAVDPLSETTDSLPADTLPMDSLAAPRRAGLLRRLRRRLSGGRLSRLRGVVRDCVEETLALLRSPEPEVSGDEPGFAGALPLEQPQPLQDISTSEPQPLREQQASPSWTLEALQPTPSAPAASDITEPLQDISTSEPQPLREQLASPSWALETLQPTPSTPAASDVSEPLEDTPTSETQPLREQQATPSWALEALQPAATAPAASDVSEPTAEPAPRLVPLATVRSIAVPRPAPEPEDSPAAPLPAPAPVSRLEVRGRKPSRFSDRPAPAPSALSDLRAWLPDRRDDLPRAS